VSKWLLSSPELPLTLLYHSLLFYTDEPLQLMALFEETAQLQLSTYHHLDAHVRSIWAV
jgi:hypothetical protein